ncbi:unnamed protein product [Chondrus crispus]|uniref:Uncharacterized protein n=1 Tax=Chondrus crispus TaxID=2769 RepID=R7QKR2_CHOCR|nr:unnamed protein product [Chondrus crispus]CDF39107.1 unnamed protein product [Chondrus crispus]|eukprot:XP_005719018.1 unnamed protein product [Chondrus crispus]
MASEVSSILPSYLTPAIPYHTFNRMQVACIEAWDSDCNMLVSAPTGSGKTLCFELALLRYLHLALTSSEKKYLPASGLPRKVVFIAPTKAICMEKGHDWKRRYAFLGLRVEIMTGDVYAAGSNSILLNADLILTTAEKWDSLTRNTCSQAVPGVLSNIALLFVDEVHHIGNSRGGTLESVITRMFVTSDQLKQNISSAQVQSLRVIALSATVKNVGEVGRWLRVDPEHILQFDQSYRPIQLEYAVLSYPIRNRWQSSKVYDSRILGVWQKFSSGKPALIFCTSRRQTSSSAAAMVENLNRVSPGSGSDGNALTKHLSFEERNQLRTEAQRCSDKSLRALLMNGVGCHNAEMSPQNRQLVERLFRECLLLCLFSTSTLAQGVNLPARLVVVAGTSVYYDGSLQECDKNMLLQMCGRAGRPGLDTKGVAVIMTSNTNARRYQNMEKALPTRLQSQLKATLEESMNAEIARQFITDIPQAMLFLKSTFYWVQEKEKHRIELLDDEGKLNALLTTTAVEAMKKLARLGLVRFDDDLFGVNSTNAGVTMAKYCLSCETLGLLMTEIPKVSSPAGALRVLAAAPEVLEGVCVRRAEKKSLNELNEFIRVPVHGKVKEPLDKAIVLIQVILNATITTSCIDFSLQSEALRLAKSVSRICSCLLSLVLGLSLKGPYEAIFSTLQVCRGLVSRCYWDGPTVLRQIRGLTSARIKALSRHGISSIEALRMADFSLIYEIIGAKSPFAKVLRERMNEIPRFYVKANATRNTHDGQITHIQVHVTYSGQLGHLKVRRRPEEGGFILLGSHSRGFLDIKAFQLDGNDKEITFQVPRDSRPSREKWIDVIVGTVNIIGIDETVRFLCDRQDQDCRSPARTALANNDKLKPKAHHKPPEHVANLSVTDGRVSKRFVQTTVSQALSRISNRKTIARVPEVRAYVVAEEEKHTKAPANVIMKAEEKAETSPDISPGPSSPSPHEANAMQSEIPTLDDANCTQAATRSQKKTQRHGRSQALFSSKKARPCLTRTEVPDAPVPEATHSSPDPCQVRKSFHKEQHCREYDDMLRSLF